jgi:hypothetical protein
VLVVRFFLSPRQIIFKKYLVWWECGTGRKILCRARWIKRTANVVRFFQAHGKQDLCRALYKICAANKTFAMRPK